MTIGINSIGKIYILVGFLKNVYFEGLTYVCDPVMGDFGPGLYVPEVNTL